MRQNRRTFLRNSALASTAAALTKFTGRAQVLANTTSSPANQTAEAVGSGASIRQQFLSPEKKYRPIARWWWPGNDVTEEELRREIGVLDKAGFGGAEIQAFNKGFDFGAMPEAQQKRVSGFATPAFFENVAAAIDEARKHGLFIDYTFVFFFKQKTAYEINRCDWSSEDRKSVV